MATRDLKYPRFRGAGDRLRPPSTRRVLVQKVAGMMRPKGLEGYIDTTDPEVPARDEHTR